MSYAVGGNEVSFSVVDENEDDASSQFRMIQGRGGPGPGYEYKRGSVPGNVNVQY